MTQLQTRGRNDWGFDGINWDSNGLSEMGSNNRILRVAVEKVKVQRMVLEKWVDVKKVNDLLE